MPTYTPLNRTAVVEVTVAVSDAPVLDIAVRSRTTRHPEPRLRFTPARVTLTYRHDGTEWTLTGTEIDGHRDDGTVAVARFVPSVHTDVPEWATDLATLMVPADDLRWYSN